MQRVDPASELPKSVQGEHGEEPVGEYVPLEHVCAYDWEMVYRIANALRSTVVLLHAISQLSPVESNTPLSCHITCDTGLNI